MSASVPVPRGAWREFPSSLLRALPDRRLARLIATGSMAALGAAYERHQQGLYRYCRSVLGNDEDAQDTLQNTMVKAMAALPGETRPIALKPWLYRVAHNESISLLRRRRLTTALDDEAEIAAPSDADPGARDRLQTLIADLEALPQRQRGALVMRELSGLSYGEIAAAFDTTVAGAKQAVYEARIALHELAEGREMECEAVRERISDCDRRLLRGRRVRAHLRACASCASFERGISTRAADLAALGPPLPAAAAAGLLHGLFGGGGGGAGGGSVAGGSLAGPGLAKVAATSIALVAATGSAVQLARHPSSRSATKPAAPVTHPSGPQWNGLSGRGGRGGSIEPGVSRTAGQPGAAGASGAHRLGAAGPAQPGGKEADGPGGATRPSGDRSPSAKAPASSPSATQAPRADSGTPAGPRDGSSVANAHRPSGLPDQASDRVPTAAPAVGPGDPSTSPQDAARPPSPEKSSRAPDSGGAPTAPAAPGVAAPPATGP